jgi:excisionase family DNA binding protein
VGVRTWEYGEVHVGVHRGVQRVPLREAAELLGVSKDAVRQRIRRGTIRSEKGEDGRVYVYVDASLDAVHEHAPRDSGAGVLVEELRDRLRYIEGQLEAERAAHAESRRLLLAALEKIPPAIEPPSEPTEAPTAATEQPGRVGAQPPLEAAQEPADSPEMAADEQQGRGPAPDARGPQEGTERPWWRRVFGG